MIALCNTLSIYLLSIHHLSSIHPSSIDQQSINLTVLTASEAELFKGNANLIELLLGSDDSTLCEGSSQQHLQLTYKRLKHFVHVT